MRTSGLGPKTSSCALTGNKLASQQQTLLRLTTQAVPPSASATAELTSSMARVFISQPPYRFGVQTLKKPALAAASIDSSTTRRLVSPSGPFLLKSGLSSRARPTSSSTVGAAAAKPRGCRSFFSGDRRSGGRRDRGRAQDRRRE